MAHVISDSHSVWRKRLMAWVVIFIFKRIFIFF
jgi:hypothetical protein